MRFLPEIDEDTIEVPDELMENQYIKEALKYVHRDALTEEELRGYDEYWDVVRVEKAAVEELKEENAKLLKEKVEETRQKEEERKQKEVAIEKLHKMVQLLKQKSGR